jgi:hypothetical protein
MQDTACGEHETLVLLREIAEGADMVHMAGPCAKTDGPFWTRFAREKSSDISILNVWHIAQEYDISARNLAYQCRLAYQPGF